MSLPRLILKSHRQERVLNGHLWVFSNEIASLEGAAAPGAIVDILSHKREFLGRGFFNPHSLIAARLLSREAVVIDAAFFERRVGEAARLRRSLFPGEGSYRLIFGESDLLPGLVVDKLADVLVVQSYCLGMDLLLPEITAALGRICPARAILKKNDSSLRALEKIPQETAVAAGEFEPPVEIEQRVNDLALRFLADPLSGQKSGFFFDQRENRERLLQYARGRSVLDCFSYSGGFALYAAQGGASEVTAVESSAPACELLRRNAALNGAAVEVFQDDVEERLAAFRKGGRKFDIIVLDPPALAKSQKNFFGALRKYIKLNELALSVLSRDGLLVSSSCSHHLGREAFLEVIAQAAAGAGRHVQVLELRGASRDHPVLPAMPETNYLKCVFARAA